ncbi:hypothetical protein [Pseudolactococcus reticulitermitis]|uniref:Uncharacterized protein n=1 Tax=Pseudolactococcus reticulitermitis TaxID=2025039 RepID=A0A224XFZ9_9LACT|nr:hypothetical protein [Lactococcus reticulitermitis]GAX48453.1 hypothetical protein RsY01_2082 [Lactococcus reticulitermitis]
MDKKKLALISVATLLSFGVTGFVSADETVSEPNQTQQVSIEQKEYDTSNIVSVFYDGKDTHVTLTNGEKWTLEDYEGKLGEFEFSSQILPVRTRGLPTSYYFTSSWSGYGNGAPSRVYIDKTLLFYYDGYIQATFKGYIGITGGYHGANGAQTVNYGGHVPRVAASPA